MKHLLVIVYAFPPCSVSGIHRPLGFVKYLEPSGWRSTVLCAENPIYPERDHRLLSQIPGSARVIRTRDVDPLAWLQRLRQQLRPRQAAPAAMGSPPPAAPVGTAGEESRWNPLRAVKGSVVRRLHPPGLVPGWYLPALWAGRRLIREQRPDALYSSGPPWTAHLVACQLAAEYGLPWVADFRDPWVSNPRPFTDEGLRRRHAVLEARLLARADVVVCVLETMRRDFLARYPHRRPQDVVTITNGFDPATFQCVGPGSGGGTGDGSASLTILHTGHLYGRRRIEPLLGALTEWIGEEPAPGPPVRVHLLGGSAEYVAELRSRVARSAAAPWVEVEPEIPHQQALQRQAEATVLLLVGFSGPGEQYQMSGKIFEYLALRRPILALAPFDSPIGDVLLATGVRHWIVSPDDPAGLLRALRDIGHQWRRGNLDGPQSSASLAAFDRRELAKQLAATLELAIATSRARTGATP